MSRLKKVPWLAAVLVFTTARAHAFPQFILYQGRYLNNGVPGTGNVSMEFRITDGNAVACGSALGGHLYWTSGTQNVALTNGVFSYKLGYQADQATQDPYFLNINWNLSGTVYYIDVCVAGTTLLPHEQIGSGIYSISAAALNVTVAGKVTIVDGNQGAGKVLTSDANGAASWQTPANSGLNVTGTGKIVIADGGEATGKVLSSNASGSASWQAPAFSNMKAFSASGPFSVPGYVTKIMVEVWAGGGGGGGGGYWDAGNAATDGSAGGGGGYARMVYSVVPNTTITVTVGAGGTAGTGATSAGGCGGAGGAGDASGVGGLVVVGAGGGGAGGQSSLGTCTPGGGTGGALTSSAASGYFSLAGSGGDQGGASFGGHPQLAAGGAGGLSGTNAIASPTSGANGSAGAPGAVIIWW